ncbi:MAG: sigma-70 family RNA polymerase sigma factor [Planctomycetales bacterium]|nr:sigma-70 family RNA polymerase sigma factor [Planctomycetales bacterium]
MDSSSRQAPAAVPAHEFATTHWSLVVSAGKPEGEEAREALSSLCQRYWFPLYAYVRRRVPNLQEAQDLTQEFFLRLIEKNAVARAAPERGRFRSFLLASLDNFLANEWDRANAKKRRGGCEVLSLDLGAGESRLNLEPTHNLTPQRLYEREWTLTLLGLAMDGLRADCESTGKLRQFELLQGALSGAREKLNYASIAAELQMTEEAVRQAAHRLRKRYRELLRAEVAQTVSDPGEVDEEIRSLLATLGS